MWVWKQLSIGNVRAVRQNHTETLQARELKKIL